jgi:hypothetical protein
MLLASILSTVIQLIRILSNYLLELVMTSSKILFIVFSFGEASLSGKKRLTSE